MPVSEGLGRALRRRLDVELVPSSSPRLRPGSACLLNPRRLEILLTAATYPGVHLRAAARTLLAALPSLRFHLTVLEARGLVAGRRDAGRVHLFIPGMFPRRHEAFLVSWEDPLDRRILRAVSDRPGLDRSHLLANLRSPASKLDRSLHRLVARGCLRATRTGGGRRYRTSAQWNRFARACHEEVVPRTARLLALLDAEGLHPSSEPLDGTRVRIAVDGPRGRIRFVWPADPLTRETA